jgi:hypothetical protein
METKGPKQDIQNLILLPLSEGWVNDEIETSCVEILCYEEFEDTKGVTRISKLTNKQHYGQTK